MHKHSFVFTVDGDAICENPICSYRFRLNEVKEILADIANGGVRETKKNPEDEACIVCFYPVRVARVDGCPNHPVLRKSNNSL